MRIRWKVITIIAFCNYICIRSCIFFLFGSVVLYISVHLYFMLPHKTEGGLAMYRSALVQNKHLSQLAKVNRSHVLSDSLKQALQVTYISDELISRAIMLLSSSSLIVVLIIRCCWFILLMYLFLNLSETWIVRLHAVLTRVCIAYLTIDSGLLPLLSG